MSKSTNLYCDITNFPPPPLFFVPFFVFNITFFSMKLIGIFSSLSYVEQNDVDYFSISQRRTYSPVQPNG